MAREATQPAYLSSDRGGAPSMNVEFQYERPEKSIKSLTCLNAKGEPVVTLEGTSFVGPSGGATIVRHPQDGPHAHAGGLFREDR